jgi:hypothetical protein
MVDSRAPWEGSAACRSVVEIIKLSDLDRGARPAEIQLPDGWWAGAASGGLGRWHELARAIEIDPRGACWSGRGPCRGAVAVPSSHHAMRSKQPHLVLRSNDAVAGDLPGAQHITRQSGTVG